MYITAGFRPIGVLSLFGRKISRLLIGCLVFANGALVGWVLDSFMDIKMKIIIIPRLTKWGNRAFLTISINILYFCHVNFHFRISNRRSNEEKLDFRIRVGWRKIRLLSTNFCVSCHVWNFFCLWPFSIKVWFFIKKKNLFLVKFPQWSIKRHEKWEH